MYQYRIYGMQVTSDREIIQFLPEETAVRLEASEGAACDACSLGAAQLPQIHIGSCKVPKHIKTETLKRAYALGPEESWIYTGPFFLYVHDGSAIEYEIMPGKSDANLNAFILGYGMSMLALQQGKLPIHSSCVADENGAILICGNSKAGKSTLTGAFLEHGYYLLSDDMTVIDYDEGGNPLAYPAFPYQKLCRDVVESKHAGEEGLIYIDEDADKFLVPWRGFYSPAPVRLKGMLFIFRNDVEELSVRPMKGMEKFNAITYNIFGRDMLGSMLYDRSIGSRSLKLAGKIPVTYLERPKDKDTVNGLIAAALEAAAAFQ